jgi:hypothetical protein
VSKREKTPQTLPQLEEEARRLAALPASERKAALDVHRRIADDPRLSQPTRDHARRVADELEARIMDFLDRHKNQKRHR